MIRPFFESPKTLGASQPRLLLISYHFPPAQTAGALRWEKFSQYAAERVEVLVTAASPAVLVLRDAWYPGWQARLDGEPATLLRADGLFRAVAVPEGTHSVVFAFRPASLRRGVALSAATGALAFAVLLIAAVVSLDGRLRPHLPLR